MKQKTLFDESKPVLKIFEVDPIELERWRYIQTAINERIKELLKMEPTEEVLAELQEYGIDFD